MKTFNSILVIALAMSVTTSCSSIMNDSYATRKPVLPPGTSKNQKSWNRPGKAEGNAVLGGLSNPRR